MEKIFSVQFTSSLHSLYSDHVMDWRSVVQIQADASPFIFSKTSIPVLRPIQTPIQRVPTTLFYVVKATIQ